MSSVSLETWQWTYRGSLSVSNFNLCSPGRPEWMCRFFPVSVIDSLYKTIFWVSLSSWLDELFHQGDMNNEYDEVFSVPLRNSLFKTHLLCTMIISAHWSSISSRFEQSMYKVSLHSCVCVCVCSKSCLLSHYSTNMTATLQIWVTWPFY